MHMYIYGYIYIRIVLASSYVTGYTILEILMMDSYEIVTHKISITKWSGDQRCLYHCENAMCK